MANFSWSFGSLGSSMHPFNHQLKLGNRESEDKPMNEPAAAAGRKMWGKHLRRQDWERGQRGDGDGDEQLLLVLAVVTGRVDELPGDLVGRVTVLRLEVNDDCAGHEVGQHDVSTTAMVGESGSLKAH